jgi:NhaA family Na+:H+ antiporter
MDKLVESLSTMKGVLPRAIRRFIELESAGGIIMMAAAALALLAANTPLAEAYKGFASAPVTIGFGEAVLAAPLKSAVKDVLMVLFFFAVGMELKREMAVGVLRDRDQILMPLLAAVGGIAAPTLIYLLIAGGLETVRGWAIPSATDIAFALAVLTIFGRGLAPSLKVFLLAIAIFDDLGAILIIALFYSSGLSGVALILSALVMGLMALANRSNVSSLIVYAVLGIALAVLFAHAGLHTTLAGVVTGLLIPLAAFDRTGHSPLDRAMHIVHPWVTYAVLPLFAFVSAGVPLGGQSFSSLLEPLPLAIILGLFLGKQVGVLGAVWLATRTGLARLPQGARLEDIYAVAVLAGIGFTMSLFIGFLAFDDPARQEQVRFGVIAGSVLSAVWGAVLLTMIGRRDRAGAQ